MGYAADGFPVYGPYGYGNPGNAGSAMTELRSGYRVRRGIRPSGPGGGYDGAYVQDYQYAAGRGDLDQCNGPELVTPEYPGGAYYYVLTAEFPFNPRCFTGTPDSSFERGGRGAARRTAGPR